MVKKKTENVVISLTEYQALQRQAVMLHTILHAAPNDRGAVVEAMIRSITKGGERK